MARETPSRLHKSPLAFAIGSLLAAGSVQAAVITVDTTADGPVGSTPGCSLRSAAASANDGTDHDDCTSGTAGADEIIFDSGLAQSTITLSEGEIAITNALTITGPVAGDPAGIVIDGNEASRIFHITGPIASYFEVGLDSVTLTGGRTTANFGQGGAVRVNSADLKLDHTLVTGNSTAGLGGYGGGLHVVFGNATLDNSVVSDNSTTGYSAGGGGLSVYSGDVTLNNSTVSGNSTTGSFARGGGLLLVSGDATLSNSTVSGNSTGDASALGGGLAVIYGNATLTHATVAYNNSAATGFDGVYSGTLTLNNSLIVQDAGETACNATAATAVNSLATDASCTGTATPAGDIALGPLADNGGPTPTHAVFFPGLAIDAAGDCGTDFGIDQDQRGLPRPGGFVAACDIGAFEFQFAPQLVLSTGLLDFGAVRVDTTGGPIILTVENVGSGPLYSAISGPAAPFSASGGSCDPILISLNPNESCTLEFEFSPATTGPIAGNVELVSNSPSSPDTVNLAGTGIAPVIGMSPVVLDFGNVPPGNTGGPLSLTVSNDGDDELEVADLSGLAAPFALSGGTCDPLPFSLAPSADCTLAFLFAPTASGPATQTVTIDSDSFGGVDTLTLQGSATPPDDEIFEDRFEARAF